MIEYSMMRTVRERKSWFWRMWALALLAVFGWMASPAFASICCCDDMAEASHSHGELSHTELSQAHSHDADHETSQVHANGSTTHIASVNGVEAHQHSQCEAAPLPVSNDQNKATLFTPVVAVTAQPFSLRTPNAPAVTTFASRAAKPRAPDRSTSSGLSPPAPLWS
jgi:hypothetical protein